MTRVDTLAKIAAAAHLANFPLFHQQDCFMEFTLPKRMEVFVPTTYVSEVDDPDLCSMVHLDEPKTPRTHRDVICVSLDDESLCWQYGRWITRIRRDSISSASVTDEVVRGNRCQSFVMHFGHHRDGPTTLLCTYVDETEWFSMLTKSISSLLPCPILFSQRPVDVPNSLA